MCFGCGEDNPGGLHLQYQDGPNGSVFSEVNLTEQHSGEPGVVHGGIQATVLDEVMGRAVHHTVCDLVGARTSVTAEFNLRFRRPCPTDQLVRAEGVVARVEWPSIHVDGRIVDGSGALLTEAVARWRVLDVDPASQ